MLRARVIPCLLLHKRHLYKTVKFKNPRYIGDPINAVKIFNEKEVDELMLVDIDATVEGREPDYDLIEDIVGEAFMPVCYGGGVKTVEQMRRLFYLGVEKVSLSSAAIEDPELVSKAASEFGSQSVVVTLDIKKTGLRRKYEVLIYNGTKKTGYDPIKLAKKMESLGAGELVINNVDRDGTFEGYDEDIIKEIVEEVNIPVIALGGAGSLEDIRNVILRAGATSAAAGSLFVYYGKLRAVLINYPSQNELENLFKEGLKVG